MARPSKYETHVASRLHEIEDWVRNGATNKQVGERLGISHDSFCVYQRNYPEFSETIKKNRDYVDGQVENALLKNALAGNITAQIFWLKNRRPKLWSDKPNYSVAGHSGEERIVIERKVVDLGAGESDDQL